MHHREITNKEAMIHKNFHTKKYLTNFTLILTNYGIDKNFLFYFDISQFQKSFIFFYLIKIFSIQFWNCESDKKNYRLIKVRILK
jgi:hypothetical protein